MEAGKVLKEVRVLCAEQKYDEAKMLIEKNKEDLEEKYAVAHEFVDLKQSSLIGRLKHFFGITE